MPSDISLARACGARINIFGSFRAWVGTRLGSEGVIAAGFGVQTDSGQRLKIAQLCVIRLASFSVNRLDDVICDPC